MATYPATAHRAAHAVCATKPSDCRGSREAAIVPAAAALQPKATCRATGALARLAAPRPGPASPPGQPAWPRRLDAAFVSLNRRLLPAQERSAEELAA